MTPRDEEDAEDVEERDEEPVTFDDEDVDDGDREEAEDAGKESGDDSDPEDDRAEKEDAEKEDANGEEERAEQFEKAVLEHGAESLDFLVRCLGPKRAPRVLKNAIARGRREWSPSGGTHPAEWFLALACEESAGIKSDPKSLKGVRFSLNAALADADEKKAPEGLVEFLHKALLRLAPGPRATLVLCGIEGRDTPEVARIMGTDEKDVRANLREGMEALRKIIKDCR